MKTASPSRPRAALLAWYKRHRRDFPWRAKPGDMANPYFVWLSEIMLQQTGTGTVIPYFQKFALRWPNVHELAKADLDEVLTAWAGLGYYARARNLHKCARFVSEKLGGEFPREYDILLTLPGVGPYTAAAITAIAFNRPAVVLDGNIERVMSRLHAVTAPLPTARSGLRAFSAALIDCARPGDMAQAMMDLGATVCTPRAPDCALCPWKKYCAAHAQNIAETLPRKPKRLPNPARMGAVFWLQRGDGAVLLRRRASSGLLGGMMEFPGTPWLPAQCAAEDHAPAKCEWRELAGRVRHVFTHFKLELTVYTGVCQNAPAEGVWAHPGTLQKFALPTLMQKVAAHVHASRNDVV